MHAADPAGREHVESEPMPSRASSRIGRVRRREGGGDGCPRTVCPLAINRGRVHACSHLQRHARGWRGLPVPMSMETDVEVMPSMNRDRSRGHRQRARTAIPRGELTSRLQMCVYSLP